MLLGIFLLSKVSTTLETSEMISGQFVHPCRRNSPKITKVNKIIVLVHTNFNTACHYFCSMFSFKVLSDRHEVVADLAQTSLLYFHSHRWAHVLLYTVSGKRSLEQAVLYQLSSNQFQLIGMSMLAEVCSFRTVRLSNPACPGPLPPLIHFRSPSKATTACFLVASVKWLMSVF